MGLVHRLSDPYDRNDAKRIESYEKTKRAYMDFRRPILKHITEPKKSIMELAAICGLVYKDGKVG